MKLSSKFPARIKNIVFDLGNVMVDLDISRTLSAFWQLRITGLEPDHIHPHQSGFFLDYEIGAIGTAGFLREIRRRYGCERVRDEEIIAAWNAMLPRVEPERFRMVKEIGNDCRTFVLSNTNEAHIEHLKTLYRDTTGGEEMEDCFERCFYSHELGCRKPDVAIYRDVTDKAGILPIETLFIDDNACNFTGAVEAGWNIRHFRAGEKIADLFD